MDDSNDEYFFKSVCDTDDWDDISVMFCINCARDRHVMFRAGLAENMCRIYEIAGIDNVHMWKKHIREILEEILNDSEGHVYWRYLVGPGERIPESVGVFGNLFYHLDEQGEHDEEKYPNAKLLLDFLGDDTDGIVLDSIRDLDSSFRPVLPYKSLHHEGIATKLLAGTGRLTKGAQRD